MNTQDRAVVKALLQYMTDKCLTGSTEFRVALKHFDITTTYMGQDIERDEFAKVLGIEHNHFVDVLYASHIDTAPHGERFKFKTKEEAVAFAARERTVGDARVNNRVLDALAAHSEALEVEAVRNLTARQAHFVFHNTAAERAEAIEAAHAEALEVDAEFNFELISREINTPDMPCTDESRSQTIRAIIAQAIHVGANSFGHVIGEHEELVETLRNAGYEDAADKVDPVIDAIGGENHKQIRASWLKALRNVSASI